MKSAYFIFLIILVTIFFSVSTLEADDQQQWLSGYQKPLKGEVINYHSFLPKEHPALLVRSLEKENYIEWQTQAAPKNISSERLSFVWISAYDTDPKTFNFNLTVNGKELFQFQNPLSNKHRSWKQHHVSGYQLSFNSTHIDRHEDQFGFMVLSVPRKLVTPGEPLTIRVQGESAGKRVWYMAFKYPLKSEIVFQQEPALIRDGDSTHQLITAEIIHLGKKGKAEITVDGNTTESPLNFGFNTIRFPFKPVKKAGKLEVKLKTSEKPETSHLVEVSPVKQVKIHLLHHSHVDIGYTHTQEDVKKIQFANLDKALRLVAKTKSFPLESRFKWNVEVMWPVEEWLSQASEEEREAFIIAVQKGYIDLNGLFTNTLTGLCRDEEMIRLFDSARRVSKQTGSPIRSAMITDIPGFSWGLVPAMAKTGIRYFSIGPNRGHRIGHLLEANADKPFWWVSPSGKEKILCWVHGEGYSLFHTGLGYKKLDSKLTPSTVFELLKTLENIEYPYSSVPVRYNIGSDNGPPDPSLPEVVRNWNKKFVSPKIIIDTTSGYFSKFEKQHGASLPKFRGDFTGHWEDGAASSARETAINLRVSEKLIQLEKLWSILSPADFPSELFQEAWEQVLLYNEHTWGSWDSVSDPDSDFTKQQWQTKKAFALKGQKLAQNLLLKLRPSQRSKAEPILNLDIFNTNSWMASGIVYIDKNVKVTGDYVTDVNGVPMLSQRLKDGRLAIMVDRVPPLGSKVIYFGVEKPLLDLASRVDENFVLTNKFLEVRVDKENGTITSILDRQTEHQFVDQSSGSGLNQYIYVDGRAPEKAKGNSEVTVSPGEQGPLISSVIVESSPPGAKSLKSEIILIAGQRSLDIKNTLDKRQVRTPEGVHFLFPFNIEKSTATLDTAWSVYSPDKEQLPGSCKNYFTIQRWADISNGQVGVTFYSPDAPLIELGALGADPIATDWNKETGDPSRLYSYVMNNYWETNYKADQEGVVEFNYSLLFHSKFDPATAERFALNRSQGFVVLPSREKAEGTNSLFELNSASVHVTSVQMKEDGMTMLIRLFNSGKKSRVIKLNWKQRKPEKMFVRYPNGRKTLNGALEISPLEIVTMEAEFPAKSTR